MINKFIKSQMSIFVIISVILVSGAIVFFSINNDSIHIFTDQKSSYRVEMFVEQCLESQTKEAVDLIGKHGGWLYHNDMIFTNREKPAEYNRIAQGFNYLGKSKIPYWYFYDDSSEEFKTNIPSYADNDEFSIRNQVKKYLQQNLEDKCIQSFKIFEDVYKINYEPKEIKSKINVEFDEDEIISSLELPIEIVEKNSENKEYIDYFSSEVNNNLWTAYHLALDIVLAESNSSFVEERILDFIAPYQRSDRKDLLPPFYGYRLKYDFTPWKIKEVEKLARQIITSHIRLIQFMNTDYEEYELEEHQKSSEFAQSFKMVYVKDYLSETSYTKEEKPKIFNRKYKDYKVTPEYQSSFFPTYFKITPSAGNILLFPRPEAMISLIPFFITEYVAGYEMTMPIVFKIKPSNDNDKFVFNLAIESNIAHNTPLKKNRDIEYDFSSMTGKDKTLLCNPVHFISKNVTLNITDPVYYGKRTYNDPKVGVNDAIVSFNCKGMTECFITKTKMNGKYLSKNITQLNMKLPINCNPGKLEVYKYGHKKLVIDNINPKSDQELNLGEYNMPSKKELELDIKIIDADSSRYGLGQSIRKTDTAFLIFKSLEDENIIDVIEINYDNQDNLSINLTTGKYNVQGFVITQKPFKIPEEQICYDTGVISNDEECEIIPETNMSAWVRAGIDYDFTTPKNFLLTDKITISFVDIGIPTSYTKLRDMSSTLGDIKGSSIKPYFEVDN